MAAPCSHPDCPHSGTSLEWVRLPRWHIAERRPLCAIHRRAFLAAGLIQEIIERVETHDTDSPSVDILLAEARDGLSDAR